MADNRLTTLNSVSLSGTTKDWKEALNANFAEIDERKTDIGDTTTLVHDGSYVHTDNNFTDAYKAALDAAEQNVQSDWNQTDTTADDYIKNKPQNLVQDASYVHTDNNYTDAEKTKLSGIATGAQVNVIETVKVNGTALTPDANKAVDVTVPTSVGSLTNDRYVRYDINNQGLGETQQGYARTNIGAGTYSKPSGGIPSTDLAESYYLASNPNNYTSNVGTVTSVSAGTGLAISAGSSTVNPTIGIDTTSATWTSKQDAKPDGTNELISNNKISTVYIPDAILGQLLYGGTVTGAGVATLSTNAKSKLGTTSNSITLTNNTTAITGYAANEGIFYVVTSDGNFASLGLKTGDWLISVGNAWDNVDNTDEVTSVQIQGTANEIVSSQSGSQTGAVSTSISLATAYGDSKNPYGVKNPNKVLAGPASGNSDGLPSFRALVKADLPSLSASDVGALADSTKYGKSLAVSGTSVSLKDQDGTVLSTITTQDTTYSSLSAASGGTDVSLVTTGEKYNWNNAATNASSAVSGLANKMDKVNPTGSGSLSINRAENTVVGTNSVAVGTLVLAEGDSAFAEGYGASAAGMYSHAAGHGTRANHKAQFVFGKFNIPDDNASAATEIGNYVEIVGNGSDSNSKSNARTLDWNGNEWLAGNLQFKSNSASYNTILQPSDLSSATANTTLTLPSTSGTIATQEYVSSAISGISVAEEISVAASDWVLTNGVYVATKTSSKRPIAFYNGDGEQVMVTLGYNGTNITVKNDNNTLTGKILAI